MHHHGKIPHYRHAKVTVVQVYAPTEVAADSENDEFYYQLQSVIDEIPSIDIKLVTGDFNAKPSGDSRGIPSSTGNHGSAHDINDNGERPLSHCSNRGISIGTHFANTNTYTIIVLDIARLKGVHRNILWLRPQPNQRQDRHILEAEEGNEK